MLLVSSFVVVLVLWLGLGLTEVASFTNGLHFGLHVLFAAFALLALRIGLQAALLHETHDEMNPGTQVLCPHCDHVVPDTAFCPNCGVATRAASRPFSLMRTMACSSFSVVSTALATGTPKSSATRLMPAPLSFDTSSK